MRCVPVNHLSLSSSSSYFCCRRILGNQFSCPFHRVLDSRDNITLHLQPSSCIIPLPYTHDIQFAKERRLGGFFWCRHLFPETRQRHPINRADRAFHNRRFSPTASSRCWVRLCPEDPTIHLPPIDSLIHPFTHSLGSSRRIESEPPSSSSRPTSVGDNNIQTQGPGSAELPSQRISEQP